MIVPLELVLQRPATSGDAHRHLSGRARGGFTLVELLTVIVVFGILIALALPQFQTVVRQAKIARAIGDIRTIQNDIMGVEAAGQPLPVSLAAIGHGNTLDPWGRPYRYLVFPGGNGVPAGARRDRFLVPINSTFDLYSVGEDGNTAPPLTSASSGDDIVRGNDGGFIGLGRKY